MAKKPQGRPTKYTPEFHDNLIYELTSDNYTIKEIAKEKFKVNPDTIYEWRKKHKNFSEAYKKGQEARIDNVEHSLYSRAKGYNYTEVVEEEHTDINGNKTYNKKTYYKHVPPDVGACMAILKTQRRNKWAESYIIDDSGCQNLKALADTIKDSIKEIDNDD